MSDDDGEDVILMSFSDEWVTLINRLSAQHGRTPEELVAFALQHLDTENDSTIVLSVAHDLARLLRRLSAQTSRTPHEVMIFALQHLETVLSITVEEPVVIRRRVDGQIDVGVIAGESETPARQEYEQTPTQLEGNHAWGDLLRHPHFGTMDVYVPLRQEWVDAKSLLEGNQHVSTSQVVHWRLRSG